MKEELERERERHAESKLKLATAEKVTSEEHVKECCTSFCTLLTPPLPSFSFFLLLLLPPPPLSSFSSQEVKASTLMDLELADYQRSMQSLEGELASREDQLQEARRASQIHLDTTQQLKKERGERAHYYMARSCSPCCDKDHQPV